MIRIEDNFPKSFITDLNNGRLNSQIELTLYRLGDAVRWEGYYRDKRVSLYWNGWYWIVESYWKGEVRGYFRHYKEKIDLNDVSQLVRAACSLIDIFSESAN